ncbi:trigger factor [archaeon BMS3Bbin15]|nr:trigger factor [archaeon BMS3Bbin15]
MIAGAGRFLRGIEEALIGMREGEEKLIDVPPEKGYADKGHRCYDRPLKIKLKLLQQIKPYHIAELHC